MKKVLISGALGALGCLLAWAVGEAFLSVAKPWADSFGPKGVSILAPPAPPDVQNKPREQVFVLPPAPPREPARITVKPPPEPPQPNVELANRLQQAGATLGYPEISLEWWNINDLDLHVIDPNGEEIWFQNKKAVRGSGGQLDVDRNAGNSSLETTPVEHIYFPFGQTVAGHYQVSVVHYTNRVQDPTAYNVEVKVNGQRLHYTNRFISNNGQLKNQDMARDTVCDFVVEPPAPEMRLSIPPRIEIPSGGSNYFRARIARGFFTEPVSLQLEDSSGSLTIGQAQIPIGATETEVVMRAADRLRGGDRTVRVSASAEAARGHIQAVELMTVTVIEPPHPNPVLEIALPPKMQLLQGDHNSFKVKVGRWYFPSAGQISIGVDTGSSGIASTGAVIGPAASESLIEVSATSQARPGKHKLRVTAVADAPYASTRAMAEIEVEVIASPPPPPQWPMAAVVGFWTALLALGLLLVWAVRQNKYFHRPLLTPREAGGLSSGALLIGGLAGAVGQMLAAWLERLQPGTLHSAGSSAVILPAVGHMVGWLLLGGLLGRGLAFYIPNLSGWRASLAGTAGGLLGISGFLWLTHIQGPGAGRVLGAVTLGFVIGSILPLIESRKAWLEIKFGPKEVITVSLGPDPISIGSDRTACTVVASGAPPIAYRFRLEQQGIVCHDIRANKTSVVPPGFRTQAGSVLVTVCSGTAPASNSPAAASPGVLSLHLSNGRTIPLPDGAKLNTKDVPGLAAQLFGGIIAQVIRHPRNPGVIGLRNLSKQKWTVVGAGSVKVEIGPGDNVQIAVGIQIDFGQVKGSIAG